MTGVDFRHVQAVVSDMDGVLWRDADPLPGLVGFFAFLREAGIPFALATNNSAKSESDYVQKLAGFGVAGIKAREIVTSRRVLIDYIRGHWPAGEPIFVIGSESLVAAIADAGFVFSDDAYVVAVGIDRGFTYDKLAHAARLIRRGAAFLATNADPYLPERDGLAPGTGSLLAAFSAASDARPVVMGKPAPQMFAAALNAVDTPPANTLMIGDRLDTDVFGAKQAGMKTALLLSGVTREGIEPAEDRRPDWTFDNLLELVDAWRSRAIG